MTDFAIWFKGGRDPLTLRGEIAQDSRSLVAFDATIAQLGGQHPSTIVILDTEGISWEINLSEVVIIQSKETESGEERNGEGQQ